MTEENKEEEKKPLYFEEELVHMFEDRFLPKIQKIANRVKNIEYSDQDVYAFRCSLVFQFDKLDGSLTYEDIKEKMQMQLQTILQKDVDKALADQEKRENESDKKD